MRALYANALREPGRAPSRGDLTGEFHGSEESDYSAVGRIADTLAAQVASLGDFVNARQLLAVAELLAGAPHLFSLGMRSEHSVAHHFAQTLSTLGAQVTLLEAAGGTGVDALRRAGPGDALLAIGLAPYSRSTIEIARRAVGRGLSVVAITDNRVSPLARLARESLIVTANSQSYFQSIAPALAAAEILAALIAAHRGIDAEKVLKEAEEQLAALDVYWDPPR
jgi:DNA-binding MurR/RpiR family transcriptional regulator